MRESEENCGKHVRQLIVELRAYEVVQNRETHHIRFRLPRDQSYFRSPHHHPIKLFFEFSRFFLPLHLLPGHAKPVNESELDLFCDHLSGGTSSRESVLVTNTPSSTISPSAVTYSQVLQHLKQKYRRQFWERVR